MSENKIITKEEYFRNSGALHDAFYEQFVTNQLLNAVIVGIGSDKIIASKDRHFNDIPLKHWDRLRPSVQRLINKKIWNVAHKEPEDGRLAWFTLAQSNCIAKAAARIHRREALRNAN